MAKTIKTKAIAKMAAPKERIFRGDKPADIAVEQLMKFDIFPLSRWERARVRAVTLEC